MPFGIQKRKIDNTPGFTLQQILEKGRQYKLQTCHLFIDFKIGYEGIERKDFYATLKVWEIPEINKIV